MESNLLILNLAYTGWWEMPQVAVLSGDTDDSFLLWLFLLPALVLILGFAWAYYRWMARFAPKFLIPMREGTLIGLVFFTPLVLIIELARWVVAYFGLMEFETAPTLREVFSVPLFVIIIFGGTYLLLRRETRRMEPPPLPTEKDTNH